LKSSGVRDALLRTVLWIGLLLVSALPSLVVDFNDGSYRQYAALTALLLLGLGHALSQLNHRKRFLACRRRFALERWAMACLVIYSTLMASYRTLHYFVVPQIREQELITAALREAHAQDATHLYIKADPQ